MGLDWDFRFLSRVEVDAYDVVIVGGSFAGLSCAYHLPRDLRVLIIERKPQAGATVESTGLITEHTRQEMASFFDVDRYITNPITTIGVVAPGLRDSFFSHTGEPWIYQTDTRALVYAMAEGLPPNVTVLTSAILEGLQEDGEGSELTCTIKGIKSTVYARFVVGADGGGSRVAQLTHGLSRNTRFLYGIERVFPGEVHFGPCPEKTIYHYWFGEFSLGYGGWLSPTNIDGNPGFRIGLAKHMRDHRDADGLLNKFTEKLQELGMLTIESGQTKADYAFASRIPIGGTLKTIHRGHTLLIGDAAGFCGAFAADGIKGAVVSGKEGAAVIGEYLAGKRSALASFSQRVDGHNGLLRYYRKQVLYRWVWDRMKRDRTFRAMYDLIQAERATFLDQFCDSKDKRRSLAWTVLKVKHIPGLIRYAWYIFLDLFPGR